MSKTINYLKKYKFVSLFAACLTLFTSLSATRRYIYDNINSSFLMARLGAEWLDISVLMTGMLAAGVVLGAIAAVLLRKKANERFLTGLYAVTGLFVFVTLLFTPYNLQMLMPDQNLQNITSIALIAVLVFQTIGVSLLTFALGTNLLLINKSGKTSTLVVVTASVAVAAVLCVLTAVYAWSFQIAVGVYAIVLTLLNAVHALFPSQKDAIDVTVRPRSKALIATEAAVIAVVITALLITGYFVFEQAVRF